MATANFPDSLPDASTVTSGQTLLAADLADQQDTDRNELIEIATKLGLVASTPTTAGHVLQVTGAGNTAYGLVDADNIAAAATTLKITQTGPLGSAQTNLDFTPPSSGYDCLELECMLRGTNASASEVLHIRFNSDSGSNYDYQVVYASSTSAAGIQGLAQAQGRVGAVASANAPSGVFTHVIIRIPFYRSTTPQKIATAVCSLKQGTSSGQMFRIDESTFWRSTAAITGIRLYLAAGNFDVGSTAILRGLPA